MNEISRYYRYLVPLLIIVCCVFFYYCWYINTPLTTVILVRHADRTAPADELNANGLARAQELKRVLDETNITAIYASTAMRTQQTAQPIATQLGIALDIYDFDNLEDLVNIIKTDHRGEVVLVVGHSNTVPSTIGLLGIAPAPPNIPDLEFDHMYIVTLGNRVVTRMLKMEYGMDTP